MATKIKYNLTVDCRGDDRISTYHVKTAEIMNIVTKNFRRLGYLIVTYDDKVRELKKGNHTVVITKEN